LKEADSDKVSVTCRRFVNSEVEFAGNDPNSALWDVRRTPDQCLINERLEFAFSLFLILVNFAETARLSVSAPETSFVSLLIVNHAVPSCGTYLAALFRVLEQARQRTAIVVESP